MTGTSSQAQPTVVCPHCLATPRHLGLGGKCKVCETRVATAYARSQVDLRPLTVPTFGWTGHGRTTYLIALTDFLTRLNLIWPEYTYREGDEPTRDFLTAGSRLIRRGKMPTRGTKSQRDRFLLLLHGLGRWGDLSLMIGDNSGKHFGGLEVSPRHAHDLIRSPYVLMMISPADLRRDTRRVDMLINSYLDALRISKVDSAAPKRGIVVTLTKADLIQRQLPTEVTRYLKEDKLSTILRSRESVLDGTPCHTLKLDDRGLRAYLDRMEKIHVALRAWLAQDSYFRSLEVKARRLGIEVRYSAVSALGEPIQGDDTLPVLWRPRRVLDPFFWLLRLEEDLGSLTNFLAKLGEADGQFQLFVHDIQRKASAHQVDLEVDSTGDLGDIDSALADLSYHYQTKGIYFQLPSQCEMSIQRNGVWSRGTGSTVLLQPGEALIVRGWEIKVRAASARSTTS